MQGKFLLIIFVMCGHKLPNKSSGSFAVNSPTSNKMPAVRYNFVTSWHKVQRYRKLKNENHFDTICAEVKDTEFMIVDDSTTRKTAAF